VTASATSRLSVACAFDQQVDVAALHPALQARTPAANLRDGSGQGLHDPDEGSDRVGAEAQRGKPAQRRTAAPD
jgi:hypothetical protein